MIYDITFHPSWWHKNAGIDFSQRFFDDAAYRVQCDVEMRRCLYEHFGDWGIGEADPVERPILGTDLLAAGHLHSALMGCEVIYAPDDAPQVVCRHLDVDGIADLKAPDLDAHPLWQTVEAQIKWLEGRFGRVEPCVNLMGVQNIALDLMGEALMTAYYTDPDAIHALLDTITKLSIDVGTRLRRLSDDISGGVTAIVRKVRPDCYLGSNCSVEMISQATYEAFLLETDQRLADAFGPFGVHHCGGTMEHVVGGYAKIRNLVFAEVGAGSDLANVRAVLPDIPLNARYSPAKLMVQSQTEIEAGVQSLYEAGQAQGGGRLSISCVGIDYQVSDDAIQAFLSACRACGTDV